MYNYVKADLVSTTIDTYLQNMMLEQSGHELNTEKLLLQANELIKASAEEVEKANQKFLDGEKVYKRLMEAKQTKTYDIDLDSGKFADYFKEIVESDGFPGIDEILNQMDKVGEVGILSIKDFLHHPLQNIEALEIQNNRWMKIS